MVRMRSPVRIWPAAPKSAWSHVGLGAFSSYRIAFRTGDLTGEACLNKTRRPPKAVTASSNLASSSTSEQSPLCSGVFYFTGNRKHHPPASLLLLSNQKPLRWASGLSFTEGSDFSASVPVRDSKPERAEETRSFHCGKLRASHIEVEAYQSMCITFWHRSWALTFTLW